MGPRLARPSPHFMTLPSLSVMLAEVCLGPLAQRQRHAHAHWGSPSSSLADDHTGDRGFGAETFDDFEFVNLAYQPEHAGTVKELSVVLQKQFDHPDATC